MKSLYYSLLFRFYCWQDARELEDMRRKVHKIFNGEGCKAKHSQRIFEMTLLYSYGGSIEQIAKDFDVTRERARQCIRKFVRDEANFEATIYEL